MTPQKAERKVTVIRESETTYPDLYLEVYIAAERGEYRNFVEMFARASCTKALSPETADLVVFGGGSDVNPRLYNEKPHSKTDFNIRRDAADIELYELCLKQGIPMFGVCRGAQFLHVMNGGKLYQDVDGHYGDHNMYDIKSQKMIPVSSVHHQMVIENKDGGMEVIADAFGAKKRWKNPTELVEGSKLDVEAYFYRDTCCFGVQGHPEYRGYQAFQVWTLDKINDLVCCNPDIGVPKDGLKNYRIKPDLLAERQSKSEVADEVIPEGVTVN